MSKKRPGESLTGGTGDVNPQFMHGQVIQSAADTTTTTQFPLPIQKVQSGGQQATIVELLKIFVDFPNFPVAVAGQSIMTMGINFSTISFGTTGPTWNEPNVFGRKSLESHNSFTAAGTMYQLFDGGPYELDLTDGAGHGILLATDNIFAQAVSGATGLTNTIPFKLLYRFKKVGLLEYIGIVQSQQ